MQEPTSEADGSSPVTLATELRTLASKLKRKLREQGTLGDFTPSQISVVSRLERDGPATVSMLARAEGVRPQSIGVTVAVLEAAGLVSGRPDPKDGRQTILDLTAACRERITAGRDARRDWLMRTIQAELSPDERKQLATGLGLLNRIIEL